MAPRVFRKRNVLSRLRLFKRRRLASLFTIRPMVFLDQGGWSTELPGPVSNLGEFISWKNRAALYCSVVTARSVPKNKEFDRQGYLLWWLRQKFKKFGVAMHARRITSSLIHVNNEYREAKKLRKVQKRKHKLRVNYLQKRIKRWEKRKLMGAIHNKIKGQEVLKDGGEPISESKTVLSQIINNLPFRAKNQISNHGERVGLLLKDPNIRAFFFSRVGRFILSSYTRKKKAQTTCIRPSLPVFFERLAFLTNNHLPSPNVAKPQFIDRTLKLHPFSVLPTTKSNTRPYTQKHNKKKFFHGALIIRNRVSLNPKQKFSIFKTCNYFLTVKFFTSLDSLILVYNIINVSSLFLYFRARIDKQVRPFFKKKSLKSYFRHYDFSVYVKKRVTWVRQSYKERKEWWAKFRMKFFRRTTYKLAALKIANMVQAPNRVPRRRQLPLPFVGSFLNKIFTKARRRWRRWRKDKRYPSLLLKKRRDPSAPLPSFRFHKAFHWARIRPSKLKFINGPFNQFRRVRSLASVSTFPKAQGVVFKRPSYKYRVPLYRHSNYPFPVYKTPSASLRSFFFRRFKPYRYKIHKFYIYRRGRYSVRRPSKFYKKAKLATLQRRKRLFKLREAQRLQKKALLSGIKVGQAHV